MLSRRRSSFTLLELLIIIGILVVLLTFVLVKTRSLIRTVQSFDIERRAEAQALEKATTQRIFDALELPRGIPVGDASIAKNICQLAITGSACTGTGVSGIDLSILVPRYIAEMPVDPAMSGSTVTGYKMYSDGEDVFVVIPYLGKPGTLRANSRGGSGQGGTESSAAGAASSAGGGSDDASLMAHWKLDETSGGTATDSSRNAHTGRLMNGPSWTAGLFSNALQFDGSNDEVSVTRTNKLDGFSAFTLAAWVQPYTIKSTDIAGSAPLQLQMLSNGRVNMRMINASNVNYGDDSNSVLPVNLWTHLAFSYDGTAMRLYVNGVLDETKTANGNVLASPTSNFFLAGNTTNGYHGKLDDVRLYSRALSASDIGSMAAQGFPGSRVAYWKLDEGGSSTTTADSSGSNQTAQLKNDPTWTATSTAPLTFSNPHSLQFDGSNDHLTAQAASALNVNHTFTISAWVFVNSSYPQQIILRRTSQGRGDEWGLSYHYGELSVMIGGNRYSRGSIPRNRWVHVAAVRAYEVVQFYINGSDVGSTSGISNTLNFGSCGTLLIGADADSDCSGNLDKYFNGRIDDLRVYNRPLSLAEVKALASGRELP